VADVVRQYPNIPCVLGHCGFPYYRDEKNMKLWRDGKAECTQCFIRGKLKVRLGLGLVSHPVSSCWLGGGIM